MKNSSSNTYRRTSEALSKEIDFLQSQLFNAKAHFDICMGLMEAWPQNIQVFNSSLAFWNLTMQAHCGMAVHYLCRVYDQDHRAIHLPNFLQAVDQSEYLFNETAFRERVKGTPGRDVDGLAKYPRSLDRQQLVEDVNFCSNKAPLIKTLIIWRSNIIAHSSYKHLILDTKPFHEKFPLPWEDLKTLIGNGFGIINRYSSLFRASEYSEAFPSHQKNDYLFVLDSIRSRIEKGAS